MSVSAAARLPTISTVVVFHDRTRFLPEAVASVRAERTSPGADLVVVGPTAPGNLPAGVRFVASPFPGLGGKLADGLRSTRGELICFLEDDDRFLPDRLDALRRAFGADPDLGFLQTAVTPIGPDGAPFRGPYPHHDAFETWRARGPIAVPARPGSTALRSLVGIPAGFNNSSIAVRRSVLAGVLPDLEAADLHVDLFLLYAALCSGLRLRFDPIPLTELRVHPGSISQGGGRPSDLPQLRAFLERTEAGRVSLAAFARRAGTPAVARAAEGQVAAEHLILRLRTPESSRAGVARDWIRAVARWDTFEVRNRGGALLLGALGVVAPRTATGLYLTARRRRDRADRGGPAPESSSGGP